MVLNSTFIEGSDVNTSRSQLIVNTSSFNGDDLRAYITLSEEIELGRNLRKTPSFALKAHLTREEIFECSILDDDEFLTALEHQNSYIHPTADFTKSIENMMKYFNEDVDIGLQSNESTPVKPSARTNKLFEAAKSKLKMEKTPEHQLKHNQYKEIPTIAELKSKYESGNTNGKFSDMKEKHSSKQFCQSSGTSRVKQIARMFNSKISQMMTREAEANFYLPLKNELSPIAEGNHASKSTARESMEKTQQNNLPNQIPLERSKPIVNLNNSRFNNFGRHDSNENNSCLIAEEMFGQLSVKDKALLYTKFIEDMASKNLKFNKQFMEAKIKRELECNDVATEKKDLVKHLTQELEVKQKCPNVLSTDIKSTQTTLHKRRAPLEPSQSQNSYMQTDSEIPAKNAEIDMEQTIQENLHITSLHVELKPSSEARVSTYQSQQNQTFPSKNLQMELTSKRNSDAMRSSLPIEAYAPPKKIRRTRAERLAPKMFFQNHHLERLFYSWLKENNGVVFNIATNTDHNVILDGSTTASNQKNHSLCLGAQNSAINRLLEEAIKKLDLNDQQEKIEYPKRRTLTSPNSEDEKTKRRPKRMAPPIPAQRTSLTVSSKIPTQQLLDDIVHEEQTINPWSFQFISPELVSLCLNLPKPPLIPSFQYDLSSNLKTNPNTNSSRHDNNASTSTSTESQQTTIFEQELISDKLNIKIDKPNPSRERDLLPKIKLNELETICDQKKADTSLSEQPKVEKCLKTYSQTTISSTKQSETEENESGLSSMPKVTTDESQPEHDVATHFHSATTSLKCNVPEILKPVKPPRKRKMRRTLSWKKENSIVESKPTASTTPPTTTDSDSECNKLRNCETSKKISPRRPTSYHAKKPWLNRIPSESELTTTLASQKSLQESNMHELDESVLRSMNSPSKIKSAYTLTVMSSPLPTGESDCIDSELTSRLFRKSPTAVCSAEHQETVKPSDLGDVFPTESFIDQGFETASNELNSPVRKTRPTLTCNARKSLQTAAPLYIKIASDLEKSRRLSASYSPYTSDSFDSPSLSSTPIKENLQQSLGNSMGIQHSPISSISLALNRRRFYEPESRRSSLAMQVIREDLAMDQKQRKQQQQQQQQQNLKPISTSPEAFTTTDSFFAKASTIDMSSHLEDRFTEEEKISKYWISAGDFTISIDIYFNSPNRLRWLYDIFSQKNCESHDLHFGIDDHKFSMHNVSEKDDFSKRLPSMKDCSHYWFSTSDLTVPFGGKYMAPDKIHRLFNFINDSREEHLKIRFGVDHFEFSNIPEFLHNSPKFSIESSYSMLVGLQAGNSNGLEGRSKYAWPSSKSSSLQTSDLDNSEFDSEQFISSELGRLSFSPFGSNHFDLSSLGSEELMMPRNSDAMMNPDILSNYFINEPLDKLFENSKKFHHDNHEANIHLKGKRFTIPQMMDILQKQKAKLEDIEKNIRNLKGSTNGIDQFKDSPEYMRYLRRVVKIIDNIGRENNFKTCSFDQLESFMSYLSRYADIWLAKCTDHMDRILNALQDRRAVQV